MSDSWQDRVKKELAELEALSSKLHHFIRSPTVNVSKVQLELLRVQLQIMATYAMVLRARLDLADC